MAHDAVLIHYHEIALKGANRERFEDLLFFNIKKTLGEELGKGLRKHYGRFVLEGTKNAEEKFKIKSVLEKTFGVANFAFSKCVPLEIKAIKKTAAELVGESLGTSFKIETKRPNKNFSLNSMEVSKEVGAHVAGETGKKVDIKKPEIICKITIADQECYISNQTFKSPGGLPVGSSGNLFVLLSGGIDSPVAAWKMMRRGARVNFVHFHSYPYTNKASIEKVKELWSELALWGGGDLYLVPFIDIQKQIMTTAEARFRVLLYRRFMLRIAEEIANKINAKAIVTGENLGQVASQTIENMSSVEKVLNLPILRPLVGENKENIIDEARKIGTYDISIRPHEDCCSLFMPKNPATKSWPEDLEREEAKLPVGEMVKKTLEKYETIHSSNSNR